MNNDDIKILICEDDLSINKLLSLTMEVEDYNYVAVQNGKEALREIISQRPDLLILDLGLPDMDGKEIISKVRGFSQLPIIVVSARGEDADKIAALDAGADDYLTKPFNTEELLARVRVSMRHKMQSTQVQPQNNIFTNGNLKIDYDTNCVYVDDKVVHLTAIEYKLLCLLAQNIGKVLTHNHIKQEIWQDGNGCDSQLSLRVFVTNLRKKLNASDYIITHIGIGYRMLNVPNVNE